MERKAPIALLHDDSIPQSWEDRQISRAGWERGRGYLMANAGTGTRPPGWWLYERGMSPPVPYQQPRILYEMGELKGAELKQCLAWFRTDYDEAQGLADRTQFWRWDGVPHELVERWDAERK